MKTLIVFKSTHLGSTKKIAVKLAKVLNAELKQPEEVDISQIEEYDFIGFGSGIYSSNFHQSILDLVSKLNNLQEMRVFIFSTSGMIYEESHRLIKQKLQDKNADIAGEFYCKGLNKNSFLKYFGGMNKDRPNENDMKRAEMFAKRVQTNAG